MHTSYSKSSTYIQSEGRPKVIRDDGTSEQSANMSKKSSTINDKPKSRITSKLENRNTNEVIPDASASMNSRFNRT